MTQQRMHEFGPTKISKSQKVPKCQVFAPHFF